MINRAELNLLKSTEEKISLTARLNQMAMESIEEKERLAAEESKREDPARAVLKAYVEMDKAMMRVMDEHIERVRRSSERNKEIFRKTSIKKEIEKRAQMRKEYFDEAAEKAEIQRRLLRLKSS